MLRTPSSSDTEQEFCVPGSSIVTDSKRKADVMIAVQSVESNETKDSMCRRVAVAIDSELGTLTVDRKDALLHGQFADINLARIVFDKDTDDVVKESVASLDRCNVQRDYETIRDESNARRESWADMTEAELEGEQVYFAAMAPLAMCRQPSRSAECVENSMYYVCATCKRPYVTRKLIQVVKDAKRETLPIWLRDLKSLLEDMAVQRVTEGMVIERFCETCFAKLLVCLTCQRQCLMTTVSLPK